MEYYVELGRSSALKSSFLSDSSSFLLDDVFSLNSAAAEVDFSSVDSFLDLSDDNKDKGAFVRREEDEEEEISNTQDKSGNLDFTTTAVAAAGVSVEFPLPQIEDFEDLEWLSRFVEYDEDNDSDSKLTFLCDVNHHRCSQPSATSPPPILLCFSSPIPARSRSKRTRLAGKPWGSTAAALSISASSSSSSSSIISYGSSNPSITSTGPPEKKRKRSWSETEKQSRRCSHCHVEKTPQWRSGPLGAKTLCNACGVRYKSGRLFPEYRPACSPSFTGELHSNSHRKVLEMRWKKEIRLE